MNTPRPKERGQMLHRFLKIQALVACIHLTFAAIFVTLVELFQ